MKSSEETRMRFKERIKDALVVVKDSEELEEALAIVEDLDDLLEVQALTAEYLYHSHNMGDDYGNWDWDDNPYDSHSKMHEGVDVTKMYEYLVNRIDLFTGMGVHAGNWRNSQHWIARTIENLKAKAEKAGFNFTPSVKKPVSRQPYTHTSQPLTPAKPATPPPSLYLAHLQDIMKRVSSQTKHNISVTHKTNGAFLLESPQKEILLYHNYVPRTVVIKDIKGHKVGVFKEDDLDRIVKCIVSHFV